MARGAPHSAVPELISALLIAAGLLYGAGLRKLWNRAGRGKGVSLAAAALFYSGCAVAAIALLGALHELAEQRLWAHMVQHELLMVLAAPLIVLGRPVETCTWALPFEARKR